MYVVTGGAGFIGSNLLAALEERGDGELVVVDRLRSNDKWRNIAKREIAEIVAPEKLFDFLAENHAKIKMVFHMGAISSTTETDADLIVTNNFKLSSVLFDWCTRHNVRLVYASSAATYGDGTQGFDDDFGVAPLSLLTIRLETLTGSKSAKVKLVMQERSASFQRASGVPISPPLSPLSARMIP